VALTAAGALPVAWVLRRAWLHPRLAELRRIGGGEARLLPVLAVAVLMAANLVGAPIVNAVSRRAEAAADHRALEVMEDPAAQIRVNRAFVTRDLADPTPPAWVVTLWGSHPSVQQRIQAAVDHAARTGQDLPDLDGLGP
jgi:STE24 endopeptidase